MFIFMLYQRLISNTMLKVKQFTISFFLFLFTFIVGASPMNNSVFLVGEDSLSNEHQEGPIKDSTQEVKSSFRAFSQNSTVLADYVGRFGTKAVSKDYKEGVPFSDIKIQGLFRFVSIYRSMQESYLDMQTSDRNLSFLDYPLTDIGLAGGVGSPLLALALTSKVGRNASFRISYSIGHSYTGQANQFSKSISSYGGLLFDGNIKTNLVTAQLKFGGVMTMRSSRLVFDAPRYRNNFFDRLVSNKYSVGKFESLYTKDEDGKSFLWPYVRGGVVKLMFPDLNKLQFTGMYGRSGNTVGGLNTVDGFPAVNYLTRLEMPYRLLGKKGRVGVSYFAKDADTDAVQGIKNDVHVLNTDFTIKLTKNIQLATDIAASRIINEAVGDKWGPAFVSQINLSKELVKIPLSLEYYNVSYDFVNLDGEILNSNVNVAGGSPTRETDQTLFVNVAQEVGLIANNRQGLNLETNFELGDFKIDIAYGLSQEKENIHDSLTFQHRVNAFSRSRFWQWRQGTGPYGRVRSIYARTFEMMTITDANNSIETDYKKGFNNLELLIKDRVTLFGKSVMLINFNNFVSMQDKFSLTPVFGDRAFIRTFYEDFTATMMFNKKFMVLVNFGYEKVWGNTRIDLSPDKVIDDFGNEYAETDRVLNQTGLAYGLGFGYDITRKASIHFRHKWMTHKDKNFLLDKFKGTESTIELKIFL